jgi:hypothetical protein
MKLSSRKQLLKEADEELRRIQKEIDNKSSLPSFQSLGSSEIEKSVPKWEVIDILKTKNPEEMKNKVQKAVDSVIDEKTEEERKKLDAALEKFKQQAARKQREYYISKVEKGETIEDWWKTQNNWERSVWEFEFQHKKEYKGTLYQKMYVSLTKFFRDFNPELADRTDAVDPSKYTHNPFTGEEVPKDIRADAIDESKIRFLRTLLQALTI